MKRLFAVIRFGILLLVSFGLGACSSAMDYTSSIGDNEALRIGSAITPTEERNRLIEMLNKVKIDHHAKAIDEIEAR